MRHYELVLIVNPDKSEKIFNFLEFYKNMILSNNGKIHRLEDWGRRSLSYSIKKLKKAHYILMNIEVSVIFLKKLEEHLKFNEFVIRKIIISVKQAITESSFILKSKDDFCRDNKKKISKVLKNVK